MHPRLRPISCSLALVALCAVPAAHAATDAPHAAACSTPTVQILTSLHAYSAGYGGKLYGVDWSGALNAGGADAGATTVTVSDETGAVLGGTVSGEAGLSAGPHTLTMRLSDACGTATGSAAITVPARDWTVRFEKLSSTALHRGKPAHITYDLYPVSESLYATSPTTARVGFSGSGLKIVSVRELQPENSLTCQSHAGVAACVAERIAPCGATFLACLVVPHGVITFMPTRKGAVTITARATPPPGDGNAADDVARLVLHIH